MTDIDIEITDAPPDVSENMYPMAEGLLVNGMRVKKGDLIFLPGDERLESTWEVIYGFDWGGLYTDSPGVFQMPRFQKWSDFVDDVETGDLQTVFLREKTAFYLDDETVQTISHFRHYHDDGVEYILTKQNRHPLETTNKFQSIEVYEDVRELVDDVYTPEEVTTSQEAKAIYNLLIDSGVNEAILAPPGEISDQAGLDSFAD